MPHFNPFYFVSLFDKFIKMKVLFLFLILAFASMASAGERGHKLIANCDPECRNKCWKDCWHNCHHEDSTSWDHIGVGMFECSRICHTGCIENAGDMSRVHNVEACDETCATSCDNSCKDKQITVGMEKESQMFNTRGGGAIRYSCLWRCFTGPTPGTLSDEDYAAVMDGYDQPAPATPEQDTEAKMGMCEEICDESCVHFQHTAFQNWQTETKNPWACRDTCEIGCKDTDGDFHRVRKYFDTESCNPGCYDSCYASCDERFGVNLDPTSSDPTAANRTRDELKAESCLFRCQTGANVGPEAKLSDEDFNDLTERYKVEEPPKKRKMARRSGGSKKQSKRGRGRKG